MNEILRLKPSLIWKYFYEISQIPRPSKYEEKIINYLINFAEKNGLEYKKDDIGNLVIKKRASDGYEDCNTTILQSHVDMVPQKNSNIKHDFKKDPINLLIEGEWLKAKDTTLGADNGIGVASMLAVLSSKALKHGNIEALFTVDEETGMTGAKNLDESMLNGKILLNLDTEDENEIIIGCADGLDVDIQIPVKKNKLPAENNLYLLSVTGLKGGHSGLDINLGRANAVLLMFELLKKLSDKFDFKINDLNCGNIRNAIPREAFVKIFLSDNIVDIKKEINTFENFINKKYKKSENHIEIKIMQLSEKSSDYININNDYLIEKILSIPNGVISYEKMFENTVKTSNNVSVVHYENNLIKIKTLVRSSNDTEKYAVAYKIKNLFPENTVNFDGDYPGWEPENNSQILQIAIAQYEKLFGKSPEIKIVHAGLECGIIKKKLNDLDIISFGPTIKYPHSPDEKIYIPSVEKYWNFLLNILENIY
jgi:dipeptidase D